ncbi:unnamed protein product [Mycena citricolor]|uniref:Uncharacterized protein n=1 Tax=Mycena citricolor TaxID=2018698 RepID=A0AAD2HT04_9AGAR|nr:unnamed protein product [Mycena citricolor]CAK5280801.1 unnamed protein product [Mycena citricolor]
MILLMWANSPRHTFGIRRAGLANGYVLACETNVGAPRSRMALGTPIVSHMARFTDLAVSILVCLSMGATRRDTWKCHRDASTMSRDRMDPDM